MSWLRLANKCAIVTGGGSGIGRQVSLSLASAGCSVVVADHDLSASLETCRLIASSSSSSSSSTTTNLKTGAAVPFKCDVRISEDCRNLVSRADDLALSISGGVGGSASSPSHASILVNVAGITRDGWISSMSESDWDDVIDVNLKGSWLMCKHFASPSRLPPPSTSSQSSSGSSIVNVSSIVGKLGNLGQSNYCASKAGVLGLTRSLSKELASRLVRVNCVLPGFIETPMAAKVPERVREKMVRNIAMREFGRTEDVADLVLFLASDRSRYMTGCEIEVDGRISM